MAAPVEAVAHPAGAGGLQGRHPGGGGQLGLGAEAPPGPEDAGQGAGGEQAHPAQLRQGHEARPDAGADLRRELRRLVHGQAQALGQPPDGGGPLLVEGAGAGRGVPLHGRQPGLGVQRRHAGAVLRVELQQEGVELVAQPRRLGHGGVPLGGEQVEDRRLVLRPHRGQGGRPTEHQPGHRQGVQGVALARAPGALARLRRPAGADLVDHLTAGDQVLGQAPAVAPRPLDRPTAGALPAQPGAHAEQVPPPGRAVGHPPPPRLPPRVVQRHRLVHPLVGVDPQRQHPSRPPLRCDRARSRGRHNSLESDGGPRPASMRPAPEEPGGGATHQNQGTRSPGPVAFGVSPPRRARPHPTESFTLLCGAGAGLTPRELGAAGCL